MPLAMFHLRHDYHVHEPDTVTALLEPDNITAALHTLGVAMRAMGLSEFPATWKEHVEQAAANTDNDPSA